jgi:uncharacterized membrane protein
MMEVFFAIATIILVYFIIFQTLFAQQGLAMNGSRFDTSGRRMDKFLSYEDQFDIDMPFEEAVIQGQNNGPNIESSSNNSNTLPASGDTGSSKPIIGGDKV